MYDNESQPTQLKPTQTLVIMTRGTCYVDHPPDVRDQTGSGDPRSIEWEQTASFAVHRDQGSDGVTPWSHQYLTHTTPNALASRPQNQSNISTSVSYHGNQTQFGQRRRDELLKHESVVEESLIVKKTFLPSHRSATTVPIPTIRATTQTSADMASAPLPQCQLPGPHTPTNRHEGATSQSSGTSTSKIGPTVPPAYLALTGFNDPEIFRPAAELDNTLPQHGLRDASPGSGDPLSASRGRSRNPVAEAHHALQQALFADGPSTASASGQGSSPKNSRAANSRELTTPQETTKG